MDNQTKDDPVAQLVEKINEFFATQTFQLVEGDEYHRRRMFVSPKGEEAEKLVSEIEYKCSEVFIKNDGSCNYTAIRIFKSMSGNVMDVVRGEYDSFGWLSGIVVTEKGCFCYG